MCSLNIVPWLFYYSFVFKLLANIVIYVCAITVGVMSYYMADRKHRKAFLEARQSLEVKLNLEEQSQQQVRGQTLQHSAFSPLGSLCSESEQKVELSIISRVAVQI